MALQRRDIPKVAKHVMERLKEDNVIVVSPEQLDELQLDIAAAIVDELQSTGIEPSAIPSRLAAFGARIATSVQNSQNVVLKKPDQLEAAVLSALQSFSPS